MVRIVNLGRTGLYVALNNGTVAVLGGRSHWNNAEDARRAAKSENVAVCDHVLRTMP